MEGSALRRLTAAWIALVVVLALAVFVFDRMQRAPQDSLQKVGRVLKPDSGFQRDLAAAKSAIRAPTATDRRDSVARSAARREEFARAYENRLLSQGMSVDVVAQGEGNTMLFFRWALVSKAFAYQMQNDADLLLSLRVFGFKSVKVTDGFRDSYSWAVR